MFASQVHKQWSCGVEYCPLGGIYNCNGNVTPLTFVKDFKISLMTAERPTLGNGTTPRAAAFGRMKTRWRWAFISLCFWTADCVGRQLLRPLLLWPYLRDGLCALKPGATGNSSFFEHFLQMFYHSEVTNAVLTSTCQNCYQSQERGRGSNPGLTQYLFVFNISKLSKNSQLKIKERLS